ncbi:hypothetical protein HMPREF2691_00540 [Lactobacillus sp. HMSC077C11]|nr:hypothetical protein HMPREF2691_00540 [Lactobacillus sp. HMSC077C11]
MTLHQPLGFLPRGARLRKSQAGAVEGNRSRATTEYGESSIKTQHKNVNAKNVNAYLDASPTPKVYFRSRKEAIRVLPDDLNVISDDVLSKASRFG